MAPDRSFGEVCERLRCSPEALQDRIFPELASSNPLPRLIHRLTASGEVGDRPGNELLGCEANALATSAPSQGVHRGHLACCIQTFGRGLFQTTGRESFAIRRRLCKDGGLAERGQ